MQQIFWIAVFGALYSYFIYPLVLMILPARRTIGSTVADSAGLPRLSLIITVHNEAARIEEKLKNTLAVDYPRELLDIVVASDCSTDNTEDVVRSFAADGVRLVRADEHNGKEYAQWLAINAAYGDILVFSDAATQIPADALRLIAAKFADPAIGAISSEDRFITEDGEIAGEGAYVKYEMWLRSLESRHAGLVGLSGSFFAARKQICERWDTQSPSDFNTALNCFRHGFTSISCPDILGYYKDIKDPQREYQRKVRTIIRGLTAISRQAEVLNPSKFGLFSLQVWSHKIMRWAVPWFLLLLLLASCALATSHWFYFLAAIGQLAAYGLVYAAWRNADLLESSSLIRLMYFFIQVNIAIAHATVAFLSGRRMTVWTPSQR
jgi:glycosyltransferase involved in cell wall biosynthesis